MRNIRPDIERFLADDPSLPPAARIMAPPLRWHGRRTPPTTRRKLSTVWRPLEYSIDGLLGVNGPLAAAMDPTSVSMINIKNHLFFITPTA